MDIIKIRYSIEPRDGFLSFAKNIGKNLSSNYSEKPVDSAQKSTTDVIKTDCFKKGNSKNSRNSWGFNWQ